MKILYAANNNPGSRLQLSRFLMAANSNHNIKIAAYKISSPKNISIDWTLDCLLNIYKPEILSLKNDNLNIYYDQIKSFAPDLIISDLEYFTSYIANVLNIRLWQYSSSLINYALKDKYDLGLFKYYAHSLNINPVYNQRIVNIIDNSERNFVYSHYGDSLNPPILNSNFEWIRPYHKTYKSYILCKHNITAALYGNNKNILNTIKKHSDCVVFTESVLENYPNIKIKNLDSQDEYYCNIKNSDIFICQGHSNFLADAFYNNKYSFIYPDYNSTESIINSQLSQKMGYGKIMYDSKDIFNIPISEISFKYQDNIKFIHEKILELDG